MQPPQEGLAFCVPVYLTKVKKDASKMALNSPAYFLVLGATMLGCCSHLSFCLLNPVISLRILFIFLRIYPEGTNKNNIIIKGRRRLQNLVLDVGQHPIIARCFIACYLGCLKGVSHRRIFGTDFEISCTIYC